LGVSSFYGISTRPGKAIVFRCYIKGPDIPVFQLRHSGGARDTDLVKCPLPTNHKCLSRSKFSQHPGYLFSKSGIIDSQNLCGCARGVCQGPKDIENGPEPNLLSRACGIFHGSVKKGCIKKSNAHFPDAPFNIALGNIQFHTKCFEHICASTLAGNSPVSMLCHPNSAACRHKGGCSGHIKGVGPVSTCAARVQDGFIFYIDVVPINIYQMILCIYLCRLGSHDPGSTGNFLHGFPLYSQGRYKGPDLGRGCFTSHDFVHGLFHLWLREVFTHHYFGH